MKISLLLCVLALLTNNVYGQSCADDCVPSEEDLAEIAGDPTCCDLDIGDCCGCAETCQPSDDDTFTDCCAEDDYTDYCGYNLTGICVSNSCANNCIAGDDDTVTDDDCCSDDSFDCDYSDDESTCLPSTSAFDSCDSGWKVDFVGKSGQFKLYPCDDSKFFIKVNFQSIQAYDSDGTKQSTNKVTTFAYAAATEATYNSSNSNVYTWSDADGNDVTLGGVELNYVFDVNGNDVTFDMILYLIDQGIEVTMTNSHGNNYTYVLNQGTLKFDYDLTGWPWNDDSDDLEITVRLTTGGTTNDGSMDDGDNTTAMSFTWGEEFGVHMLDTYEHVTLGGVSSSKDVSVDCENTGSGKQTDCSFLFDDAGGANELYYDPFISSGGSESNALFSNNVSVVMYCVVSLMVVLGNVF